MDRGEEGIIRTLSALKKAQFDFTGCYNCKEDAENVFVKTLNGVKIAFLSYTYGMNSEYHGKLLAPEKEFMVDILKRQAPYVKRKLSVKSRIRRLVANCIPSCIKSILRPKEILLFLQGYWIMLMQVRLIMKTIFVTLIVCMTKFKKPVIWPILLLFVCIVEGSIIMK